MSKKKKDRGRDGGYLVLTVSCHEDDTIAVRMPLTADELLQLVTHVSERKNRDIDGPFVAQVRRWLEDSENGDVLIIDKGHVVVRVMDVHTIESSKVYTLSAAKLTDEELLDEESDDPWDWRPDDRPLKKPKKPGCRRSHDDED